MKRRLLGVCLAQGFLILCGLTVLLYAAFYLSGQTFWLAVIIWFLGTLNGIGAVCMGRVLQDYAQ